MWLAISVITPCQLIGVKDEVRSKYFPFITHQTTFNFDISNYTAIYTPMEACTGGVSLYISNRHSFKPRSNFSNLCYKARALESTFAEVFFGSKNRNIVGCYRYFLTIFNQQNFILDRLLRH